MSGWRKIEPGDEDYKYLREGGTLCDWPYGVRHKLPKNGKRLSPHYTWQEKVHPTVFIVNEGEDEAIEVCHAHLPYYLGAK